MNESPPIREPPLIAAADACPYRDLLPFEESDEPYFFGRSDERRLIIDNLRAANLTILYGPSGAGKTSLLRAGVVARLQKEAQEAKAAFGESEFVAVYFNRWQREPLRGLADEIEAALHSICGNVGQPFEFKESLPEMMAAWRERYSFDGEFLVILDQFEDFFKYPGNLQSGFSGALPALVRDNHLLAHVLIAVRDDSMVLLDRFKGSIPNLLDNRLELSHLSRQSAVAAMLEPLRVFREKYGEASGPTSLDPELAGQVADEITAAQQKLAPADAHRVQAPYLQLVMTRWWRTEKARGSRLLTANTLRTSLGGVKHIAESHFTESMAALPTAQRAVAAEAFKMMVTPTGRRIAHTVSELAGEGTEPGKVADLLTIFYRDRIVVSVSPPKGSRDDDPCFEFAHDVIAQAALEWHKDWERRKERVRRARRRTNLVAVIATCAIAATVALISVRQRDMKRELFRNTEQKLAELRGMSAADQVKWAEGQVDSVAAYLLWKDGLVDRFDRLKGLLSSYPDVLPTGYGTARSGIEFVAFAESKDWPLTVRYSPARTKFDQWYFAQAWQAFAKSFAEEWGIPVPMRVRFEPDAGLPEPVFRLTASDARSLDVDLAARGLADIEQKFVISSADLSGPTHEFFARFKTEWRELKGPKQGGPFWLVPRWSLPVWKVSGQLATHGSGGPAFVIAIDLLQQHPELLLGQQVVDWMLTRCRATHAETVDEVKRVRGERLSDDLAEVVKLGVPLTNLPLLLDALAQYPDASSVEAARSATMNVVSNVATLPSHLRDRRSPPAATEPVTALAVRRSAGGNPSAAAAAVPAAPAPDDNHKRQFDLAYKEVDRWLPTANPWVRVYLGSELEAAWMAGADLSGELKNGLEAGRVGMIRATGLDVPYTEFFDRTWDRQLRPREFRVELLAETREDQDAGPVLLARASGMETVIGAVRDRAIHWRVHWVTAEYTKLRLARFDAGLRDWLTERYSLTDLKLLLRAVVNPTTNELARRESNAAVELPPEHTLGYLEWLLASLVFWAQVGDLYDVEEVTRFLHLTQAARLRPNAADFDRSAVSRDVEDGLRALEAHRLADAENRFQTAVGTDPVAAETAFLKAYPASLQPSLIHHYSVLFAQKNGSLSRVSRVELEEFIAARGDLIPPPALRMLKLGLLEWSSTGVDWRRRHALARDLLSGYGAPDDWPAASACRLALATLREFDATRDDIELRTNAERFLKSALPRLPPKEGLEALDVLLTRAAGSGPHRWLWELLTELTVTLTDTEALLRIAGSLAGREPLGDLERALSLAKRVEASLPADARAQLDFARYVQGVSLARLKLFHGRNDAADAVRLLQPLLGSEQLAKSAYWHLEELYFAERQYSGARELRRAIPAGLATIDDDFWLELLAGNPARAESLIRDAVQSARLKGGNYDINVLFTGALGQLLMQSGTWEETARRFLATGHDYVPYIAMMLSSRMANDRRGAALNVLEARWRKVNPQTLKVRLQEGDESAWREMLIGYYLGRVKREEIFGPIEDDAAYARSEFRHVPLTRKSLLCEAYFYEAWKSAAERDSAAYDRSLRKVVALDHSCYFEHKMAVYLLEATSLPQTTY